MRPSDESSPRREVGSRQAIATTTIREQSLSSGKDTAQADLFAYAKQIAETGRDTGLAAAALSDPDWADRARAWIADLRHGTEFSADDIAADLGRSRAVGPAIRGASRAELMVPTGAVIESQAVSRSRGIQRVWRRT